MLSTTGMCGPEASLVMKNLVAIVLEKNHDLQYSVVMGQPRCILSLCLLRWAITCMRGSRSSYRRSNRAFGIAIVLCRYGNVFVGSFT